MSQAFKKVKSDGNDAPEVNQPGLEFYNNYKNARTREEMNHQQPSFIYANAAPPSAPARRICGLRRPTFFLSLALVLVIALAAAIGGGVGGTIVQQKDQQLAEARAEISELKKGSPASPSGTPSETKTGANSVATVTTVPKASSDCLQHANKNFHSNSSSGLGYTRICGSNIDLDSAASVHNYFQGVQLTFEGCILMCDSYNANLVTRNLTVINYNYAGVAEQIPGMCWCTSAEDYKITNYQGFDSAFLVGSFDQGDIP